MREIKFRAWSRKEHKIIPLDGIQGDMGFVSKGSYHVWYEGERIMQYTGLKDDHGIEIYEGDIVDADWYSYDEPIDGVRGEVAYFDSETAFVIWNEKQKDSHYLLKGTAYAFHIEVIGNIYENPELLEE